MNPDREVTLGGDDMDWVVNTAQARQRSSASKRSRGYRGATNKYGQALVLHIYGCMGELAFAVWKGLVWSASVDQYRNGFDVGNMEVRCPQNPQRGLYIRPADALNKRYVLVRVVSEDPWPKLRIMGSRTGEDILSLGRVTNFGNPNRGEVRELPDLLLEQIYD